MDLVTWSEPNSVKEVLELLTRKSLGEDVGKLITSGDVLHRNLTSFIEIADEAVLDVNVLGTLVDAAILDHLNRGLIVDQERSRRLQRHVDRRKEIAKPEGLLTGSGASNKLCLGAGGRDGGLLLRAPRDCAPRKNGDVPRGRFAISFVASPVGVRIDSGLGRANVPIIDEDVIGGAAQVSENTVDGVEVFDTRCSGVWRETTPTA